MRDVRRRPQIATTSVWLCAFVMFILRLRSFNALEQQLRQPRRWESWVGRRKPSADTIGRVFSQISLVELRDLLVGLNRSTWRNKAIQVRTGESYRVVAVDGHELWSSRARCCSNCLVREIMIKDEKVLEYHHRVVVAQWIGVVPPAILDLELILPHEGEVTAAARLLDRVFVNYARLVDVISADALYLQAPFIRSVLQAGKHVVIVMKQEDRELFQDADQLRGLVPSQLIDDGPRTTRLWDISDLTSFTTLGQSVRVVWAQEQTLRRKVVGGKPQTLPEDKTWIWVTDLPDSMIPASKIQQWGHDRWDLENRGFNELATLWHMDHCFIHHPTALQALLLTLAIAFLTSYLFYQRNLKSAARLHLTRLELATRLLQEAWLLDGNTIWPSFQPSG